MLSENTENREMSVYDNMCVQLDATLVPRVVPSNSSTSSYTSKKIFLRKTVGWARLLLLFLLVLSPVSAGPVRERRTHRPTTHARHTSLEWQITQQRLRRSEPRHHSSSSSSSSRGGSSRYNSMGDRADDAGSSRSRRTTTVHWSEPCSWVSKNPNNTQLDLSKHILHELSTAHSFLLDFRVKYAQSATDSTHGNQWENLLHNTKDFKKLPFLIAAEPQNPEDFNSQLLHAYEKMQRLAVGIEQVTLDQALYQGELLQDFRTIETHIVKILCQLHYAMVHQELKPPVNVTKMIMGEEYRDLDGTSDRSVRDSIIVREYNHAIDHLKDIFLKFEKL